MRQVAFFGTENPYVVEFQPLGSMERHDRGTVTGLGGSRGRVHQSVHKSTIQLAENAFQAMQK